MVRLKWILIGLKEKLETLPLVKKIGCLSAIKVVAKYIPFFYSLVLSALLNKLNPRLYLHFLLSKIHDIRRGTIDPITLLPHTINQNELTAFANKLFADAKKVLDTF